MAIAARALRRNAGLLQTDLVRGGRSRHFVRSIETGDVGRLRIDDVRAHFDDLGAYTKLSVSWNGAQLDRLIDERHAAVVEQAIEIVRGYGWPTLSEVTFAKYGERGSIDVFAADERRSAVFIGEAKSAWGSLEETNRSLDVKARLAPTVTFDRLGWRPRWVAKVLIFPDDSSARRVAARYGATISSVYPARAREIRAWLRRPEGNLAGLWFLSNVR